MLDTTSLTLDFWEHAWNGKMMGDYFGFGCQALWNHTLENQMLRHPLNSGSLVSGEILLYFDCGLSCSRRYSVYTLAAGPTSSQNMDISFVRE